jgi:hypothetical protein
MRQVCGGHWLKPDFLSQRKDARRDPAGFFIARRPRGQRKSSEK